MATPDTERGNVGSGDVSGERSAGHPAPPSPAPGSLVARLDLMRQYRFVAERLPGWRRIGDILLELGYATQEQVEEGLRVQRGSRAGRAPLKGLLDTLQQMGILTAAQAEHTLQHQITYYFLPALAAAIGDRDQALAEARATQQQTRQTIARYAEEIQVAVREADALRKQVEELKSLLACGDI